MVIFQYSAGNIAVTKTFNIENFEILVKKKNQGLGWKLDNNWKFYKYTKECSTIGDSNFRTFLYWIESKTFQDVSINIQLRKVFPTKWTQFIK